MTPQSSGWKTRSSIPAEAGIGLRFQHHQAVLDTRPEVAWLEVHTENYMGGGTPLAYLDAIRRDYPISVHGIGLSCQLAPPSSDTARNASLNVEPSGVLGAT